MAGIFWIVNEDGENVRICNSTGSDGYEYKIREKELTVWRIINEEGLIGGEFELHYEPFLSND